MKKIIKTTEAPGAVGPYSQAVKVGSWLFISGQIPFNARGEPTAGGIREETLQVMENLGAVLKAADLSMKNLVKTTVYLKNMDDFARFNEVYQQFFSSAPPARSCVEVAALPKGVNIEIEAIAFYGD